jgi:hypothetical protein
MTIELETSWIRLRFQSRRRNGNPSMLPREEIASESILNESDLQPEYISNCFVICRVPSL